MRSAPQIARTVVGVLLGLLIAVRLLAPAGFMPQFDRGAVTIVACADAENGAAPMSAHHDGHSKKLHQPCPYASASGLGAVSADAVVHAGVLILGCALLLGRTFLFLERSRANERPPLRGPPVLA
jgi:hypothetical protein